MNYYCYQEWPDGKTCQRCAAEIHTGWVIDGQEYGPTCGKKILKSARVSWPDKYGPGSFDSVAMKRAIELQRYEDGRWVYDYEVRKAHKLIVGIAGWKIAQAIASGKTIALRTDEAQACYKAAMGQD